MLLLSCDGLFVTVVRHIISYCYVTPYQFYGTINAMTHPINVVTHSITTYLPPPPSYVLTHTTSHVPTELALALIQRITSRLNPLLTHPRIHELPQRLVEGTMMMSLYHLTPFRHSLTYKTSSLTHALNTSSRNTYNQLTYHILLNSPSQHLL